MAITDIEKRVKSFEKSHQELNRLILKAYVALKRMLLESESMPDETLICLAKKVKPLVRIERDTLKKCWNKSTPNMLVWVNSSDIAQSFFYDFDASKSLIRDNSENIISANNLEKVSEFVCYHRYGGYYGILRPGVDEVIQQMPKYLLEDKDAEYGFELVFPSTQFHALYDPVLDRHVSSVIVYKVTSGFPEQVRNQKVIYKEKEF